MKIRFTLPRARGLAAVQRALPVLLATGLCAHAHAQSQVRIYGKVAASVDHVRISGGGKPDAHVTAVSSQASRITFDGREDLGGGLGAAFKLESNLQTDTGVLGNATSFFNRESWVALNSASWGELRIGRNYVPMDDLTAPLDPFYYDGIGAAFPMTIYAPRFNNALYYISPRIGGFQLRAIHSVAEGIAGGQVNGFGAAYGNARFDIHTAYSHVKNAVAGGGERREWMVGGDYKFGGGPFAAPRLTAFHIRRKDDGAAERWTTLVGTNWNAGPGEIRASYQWERQAGARASRTAMEYVYALSRRTALVAGVARLRNGTGFQETLYPVMPALSSGQSVTGTSFGTRHSF